VKAIRLLAFACGVTILAAALAGAIHHEVLSSGRAWAHFAAGLVGVCVGLLVWVRRPQSRIGPLLAAVPVAGTLSELPKVFPSSALAVTVGFAAIQLGAPLIAHTTLSYPGDRPTSQPDRAFIAIVYTFAVVYALPFLLFYSPRSPHDPDYWECVSCALPMTHVAWYDVTRLRRILDAILLVLVVVFLCLLIRKLLRASPGARRVFLPLLVCVFLLAARFAVLIVLSLRGSTKTFWTSSALFWSETIGVLGGSLALGVGLLWARSARSAVADLVVDLERTPPGSVRDLLAKTMGDPSLELALWARDRGSYVDADGRLLELPTNDRRRAVTVLGAAGAPTAALIHDPALLEQPALLRSAGAAARLTIENERLQAELRLQLAEVRASRARIVRAGDEERQRLERDLHDGAQQRLLSLGLALQLVRTALGPGTSDALALLGEADSELSGALHELRELAQGIHPAVLTEHGLGPAIRTLAAHCPLPVEIQAVPQRRLPEPVEAAAYFVASEALTNAAKHAHTSAVSVSVVCRGGVVVVEVDDDGPGGAEARPGHGLAGLVDRVQALDGQFSIRSGAGCGTHLRAEVPYAAPSDGR
jgi:signal transduction histidine kinase